MTKQALIAYSIGNFKDEVLCDVLPMDACHMLLVRPWQFDKSVIHHGQTNTYSFKIKDCSYTLTPLPPSQVQPSSKINAEGNTSKKALFLIETWVESSISNDEMVYALLLLEKGEEETPLHLLAQPLI